MVYFQSEKPARGKQLGFKHPKKNTRQLLKKRLLVIKNLNLLFICSRNQWRSPTAEEIWRKKPNFNARSAGTSPKAKKTVSSKDIRWADIIFVMEKKHKTRLVAEFTQLLNHKPIHVLDIPDEYKYMEPELVDELEARVNVYTA